MKFPPRLQQSFLAVAIACMASNAFANDAEKTIRIGIIGLDTSHVVKFTELLNAKKPSPELAGCRVVAAYPQGSPDIESSTRRVPGYTAELQKMDVTIVDSIDELIKQVDAVLLETNDGRPHLEQVLPVLKAGKPTFIDKPVAGSLADAVAIYEAAEKYNARIFSASSLRYGKNTLAARNGAVGKIIGCNTFSPCKLEATHPDLYWYGIHGVESLFTVMGTGCETVQRIHTDGTDIVIGIWKDGRVGTFRGTRTGKNKYGGTAFGTQGTLAVGESPGYKPLIVDIVRFLRGGKPAMTPEETLEIYAFMEAADESKRRSGAVVTIQEVMDKANKEVKIKDLIATLLTRVEPSSAKLLTISEPCDPGRPRPRAAEKKSQSPNSNNQN